MLLKSPGLPKTLSALVAFAALAGLVSCSSSGTTSTGGASRLTFRAFVSNPVYPNLSGGGSSALNIVDARKDLLSPYVVSLSTLNASVSGAGTMSLSPKSRPHTGDEPRRLEACGSG